MNNKKNESLDYKKPSGGERVSWATHLLLAMLGLVIFSGSFAFAGTSESDGNLSFELKTLATGTAPFESNNNPGNDANEANDYLRTLDTVSLEVQFTTFKELKDASVSVEIPKELALSGVPAYCKTGSSLISSTTTGVQTLTCLIAGNNPVSDPDSTIKQSSILSLPLQLTSLTRDRLGNNIANGDEPDRVTASITATEANGNNNTPSNLNSTANKLIISARPKFDLDIKSLENPIYREVLNDDNGEPGVVYQVPILVKVENGKGTEVLLDDIVFQASMTNVDTPSSQVPFRLINWPGASVNYSPGCYENSNLDNKKVRGQLPYGYYESDEPDSSVAGNASYSCTQANPGDPVTITIANADTSALHTPDKVYNGGSLAVDDRYVVAGLLNYWVPLSYVDANDGEITVRNSYTELTTRGVSLSNNAESNLNNNTTDDYDILSTRGTFNSYYAKDYSSDRTKTLEPMTSRNSGNGVVMPTQVFGYRMISTNNGALPWNGGLVDDGAGGYTGQGYSICTRIDNRTYVVDPLSSDPSIAHKRYQTSTEVSAKVEYGTGGGILSNGIYYYDTDGDGDPLTNGQSTFEEMRTTTCDDTDSPSNWYEDIRDVPGGPEAVTKVRIVALEPVEPDAKFDLGLNLKALTHDPISNTSLVEGTLMPAYTTRTNYNDSNWDSSNYEPIDHNGRKSTGDRLRLTRALARVAKTTLPDDSKNSVLAGQTVDFQLAPSFTSILKPAPVQSYDVVLVDTLPSTLSYVANSASRIPDSVTVNGDGTTTITWTISNVLLDSTITPVTFTAKARFDVSNGTLATNSVLVSSIADGSEVEDRTATRSVVIGNSGAFNVVKESLTPLAAPGDDIDYQLSFANIGSSDLSTGDFIDILPFIGDGSININDEGVLDIPGTTMARTPATNFTPTATGSVNLISVTPSYANESFLYTKVAGGDIFIDSTHSSNLDGGSTQWCTEIEMAALTAGCPVDFTEVTGIRILTPIFLKNTATRDVLIKLSHDGKPAELQGNSFGGRVDGIVGLVYSEAYTEMELPVIGLAKDATVSAGPRPSTYNVMYDFYLKNLSSLSTLSALSLPDDLNSVFGVKTVDWDFVSLTKVSGPASIDTNAAYDGDSVIEMINAGSSLASQESAQLQLVIEVYKTPGTYSNQATLTAEDSIGNVYTDLSNSGKAAAIDPDSDGNPNEMDMGGGMDANSDENLPTSIVLNGVDFGDAPTSFGDVTHVFSVSPSIFLGTKSPDSESATQLGGDAGVSAMGDDSDSGGDDEDGISVFPALTAGDTGYEIPASNITASGTATLHAWVDFDGDGVFESGEYSSIPVNDGVVGTSLIWANQSPVTAGTTFVRFRLTSATLSDDVSTADADERATVAASDGEVEDYILPINRELYPVTPKPIGACIVDQTLIEYLFDDGTTQGWTSTASSQDANKPYGLKTSMNNIGNADGTVTDPTVHDDVNGGLGQGSPSGGGFAGAFDGGYFTPLWASPDLNAAYPALYGGVFSFERWNWAKSKASANYIELSQDAVIMGISGRLVLDYATSAVAPDLANSQWVTIERRLQPSSEWFYIPNTDLSDETGRVAASASDFKSVLDSVQAVIIAPGNITSSDFVTTGDGQITERYAIDTIRLVSCISDLSDAPASGTLPNKSVGSITYGEAIHIITSTIQLGDDIDAESSSIANDDASGDGNDDDGIAEFLTLTAGDTSYKLIKTRITATGTGILHAWIDFNGNGVFESFEHARTDVTAGALSGDLSWSSQSTMNAGTTFVRFRFTSDASVTENTPSGFAFDGEVEDYPVLVIKAGVTVSGRVFRDINVNGANDSGEVGVTELPVVLYDTTSGTCISTRTNGNGDYQFEKVTAGNYQVYEASREQVPVPTQCGSPFAKDPGGYRSTTANALAAFDVSSSDITGKDFGDVKPPVFEPNNSNQILPGNVLFYAHRFTTPTQGTVSFTSVSGSNVTAGWASLMYQDSNCNGRLDGTEGSAAMSGTRTGTATASTWVSDVVGPVAAGGNVCLINKVYAPSNVAANDRYQQTITANFNYANASGVTNTIAGSQSLTVTDTTTAKQVQAPALPATPVVEAAPAVVVEVPAQPATPNVPATETTPEVPSTPYIPEVAPVPEQLPVAATPVVPEVGPSRLELRKTVRNIDMAGSVETEAVNTAKPGDTLEYRIYYRNTGTGPLDELIINDVVPPYTELVSGTDCGTLVSNMTCDDSPLGLDVNLKWVFGGILKGGSGSFVSYQVLIDD